MRAYRLALSVTTAAVLLALGACTPDRGTALSRLPQVGGSLVALDSNGVLVSLAAGNLRPQWKLDLGARDRDARFGRYPRHVLAVDARRQVYVAAPPWLFVVDGGTGQVRAAVALPRDVDWAAPAVVDDGVYLAGADRTGAPMVALVAAAAHQVTDTATVRPAAGRDWAVYGTAVFAGGSRLAISYHGEKTTGIDVMDLGQLEPLGCPGVPAGAECTTQVHGDLATYSGGLVAATGLASLLLLDSTGREVRRLPTGLLNNHLMEIAVDAAHQAVYALGPCGYAGGLARIALPGGPSRLLVRPGRAAVALGDDLPRNGLRNLADSSTGPGTVCGDRVLVAPGGGVLAVVDVRGVVTVDAGTGALLARRPMGGPVIDAAMVS
jgi:hypothetical protein